MNYLDAKRAASEKFDPTDPNQIDDFWAELKRLEATPEVVAATGDEGEVEASEDEESGWVVFLREGASGRPSYTFEHWVDGSGVSLCGKTFEGEPMHPSDTPREGSRCKCCERRLALRWAHRAAIA